MLSPKQFAERIGKPYPTVMSWLQSGKVPQAVKTTTPTGHFWEIPEGTPAPEVRRGRPKASEQPSKRGARSNDR